MLFRIALYRIAMGIAVVSLVACVSHELEYDMGSSVAQMVDSQVYNRDAVNNPPKGVVGGMDGGAGENVINSYRQTDTKKTSVSEEVEFSMGDN